MDFKKPAEFIYMLENEYGAGYLGRLGLESYLKLVGRYITKMTHLGHSGRRVEDPIDALASGRINCIGKSALYIYALGTRSNCIPALLITGDHADATALMPRSGKLLVIEDRYVYRESGAASLPDSPSHSVLARWQREKRTSGLYRAYSFDGVSADSAEAVTVCQTFFGQRFSEQIGLPSAPTESVALIVGEDALSAVQAIIGYYSAGVAERPDYIQEFSLLLPRLQPVVDSFSAVR